MPDSIVRSTLREIEPLSVTDTVATAIRRILDEGLPALPAVDEDGKFAGIFGEREFMRALFPGYMDTLKSAAMVSRSIDETIEQKVRMAAAHESQYFEWLPFNAGALAQVPPAADPEGRLTWLSERYYARARRVAQRHADKLPGGCEFAEVFQISEYGTRPKGEELAALFGLG